MVVVMAVRPHGVSHLSNIEKMKAESVWSDEQSRWKVPDLVVQKTKLPPAGRPCQGNVLLGE